MSFAVKPIGHQRPSKPNIVQIVRVILFNLLLFVGLLLILEFSLWTFFPIRTEGLSVIRLISQNLPGLKKEITYSRNDNGLRSLSMTQYAKADNVIRVLCIGASTTEQVTQETKDTWCALIETKLNELYGDKYGMQFQTVNYGRGGLRAIDNAQYLLENTDKIQPDIVITLFGINDLAWNGGKDYVYKSPEVELKKKKSKIRKFFRTYSQIRRRLKLVKRKFSIATGRSVEWHSENLPSLRKKYQSLKYRETISRDPDPLEEFKDSVNWIVKYLIGRDTPVVLLGQPVLWSANMTEDQVRALWFPVSTHDGPVRPSGTWLQKEMRRYNDVQRQIALTYKNQNIWYKDLEAVIPKTLDYFFDDCHYTDLGSAKVAEEVLPIVLKAVDLVLTKKSSPRIRSSRTADAAWVSRVRFAARREKFFTVTVAAD